ncbi:MAG TPA: FAD-dependent oxidoreductase, partial [Candidatus Dormibacteraeota bacterium]|nr:FAD-dependent oxidoreductase [Candidatus Dormibacteraeota bacterium]
PDADRRRTLLTVAVVGGGPTGIEYAGALAELLRLVLAREFGHLDQREMRVILLEAADHLLGPFALPLRQYAVEQLRRRGVEVRLRTRVTAIERGGVRLHDGSEIAAGTVVWVAGVRAAPPPGLTGAGDARGPRGAVPVTAALQLPGHPEVLVVGDGAAVVQEGSPLPMIAPVAMQEGRHAAQVIAARLRGEAPPPFRYTDKGVMATIGRHDAVVQVGPWRLHGFAAWVTWLLLHLVLIISFRNRLLVVINWAANYLFYDRPVRLILRARPDPDPPVAEDPGSPG